MLQLKIDRDGPRIGASNGGSGVSSKTQCFVDARCPLRRDADLLAFLRSNLEEDDYHDGWQPIRRRPAPKREAS